MQRSDFHFELPRELIAQYPQESRSHSRLLCLNGANGELRDCRFTDLLSQLRAGDLLVFNDTRVIPARLFGRKASGGRMEMLVERVLDERRVLAHIQASKAPKAGGRLILAESVEAEVMGRVDDLFEVRFLDPRPVLSLLELHGHIPLPPYITREDADTDRDRYQTVYARHPGAVAAPTAGLHFDEAMLEALQAKGVETGFLTLHVGAGTFQPLRVDDLSEHRMHPERIDVGEELCRQIAETHRRGGRVVAVGTTVVRSLEAAAAGGELKPYQGETRLFIVPGYEFRVVDALVTNFHLPESTLLMLVCAFGGYEQVMQAYHHAVAQRYRFFSYGDAMYIEKQSKD